MIFVNGVEFTGWAAPIALTRLVRKVVSANVPAATAENDHPPPATDASPPVWRVLRAVVDRLGCNWGHAANAAPQPTDAALVQARPPNMANREPLPMSTGTTNVGIGLTAQITSRPQRVGFRPERLFVSNYSLDGLGATAWTINDIPIGNVSQLAQAGNLPGDMFANVAIDSFVTFKTAQTAMDVVLITTYNGTTEGGIPFTGGRVPVTVTPAVGESSAPAGLAAAAQMMSQFRREVDNECYVGA